MNRKKLFCLVAGVVFGLILNPDTAACQAEPFFVTIGSGDVTGVYFPAGLTIARMINDKQERYGIRAAVESTRGSVFNLNALSAGYLEFGLAQSDIQYQAVKGLAPWKEKGPQRDLRSVFSIHLESINLVAAVDAGITTIADLEGKRVNIGNPGSGQYRNAVDALSAVGLDPRKDIFPETARAFEAPELLENNRIDAFFCTLGNPNETLLTATSGKRKVRFVPVTGPGIDRMIAEKPYYVKTTIPVATFYPGAEAPAEVETFGVVATLTTTTKVPSGVVYRITREVFDNLRQFRKGHPAFEKLSRERMLRGLSAPLHPGAIMYFKEIGLIE
jgi:TRAP transporter TAXI family solute receptor